MKKKKLLSDILKLLFKYEDSKCAILGCEIITSKNRYVFDGEKFCKYKLRS